MPVAARISLVSEEFFGTHALLILHPNIRRRAHACHRETQNEASQTVDSRTKSQKTKCQKTKSQMQKVKMDKSQMEKSQMDKSQNG